MATVKFRGWSALRHQRKHTPSTATRTLIGRQRIRYLKSSTIPCCHYHCYHHCCILTTFNRSTKKQLQHTHGFTLQNKIWILTKTPLFTKSSTMPKVLLATTYDTPACQINLVRGKILTAVHSSTITVSARPRPNLRAA